MLTVCARPVRAFPMIRARCDSLPSRSAVTLPRRGIGAVTVLLTGLLLIRGVPSVSIISAPWRNREG